VGTLIVVPGPGCRVVGDGNEVGYHGSNRDR
jgi:hypothetical protein